MAASVAQIKLSPPTVRDSSWLHVIDGSDVSPEEADSLPPALNGDLKSESRPLRIVIGDLKGGDFTWLMLKDKETDMLGIFSFSEMEDKCLLKAVQIHGLKKKFKTLVL
ncbi:hypothetical protein TL16_g07186 [Triparma laevis f. inornata]|uniref:Uncharacterized protein n=1 Tax=Triparma laevis f. inornata TaxID=1714386 RepID=A0A9W7AXD2_9STRA|nr:hypothetical protein TL16_g07186 [Triparma laevis f. inornata]